MNGTQKSQIIVTNTPGSVLETLLASLQTSNYRLFEREDFLIEDAHELIAHAYIASETTKWLIVNTISINAVSQNSLLKLLEEPPRNVVVIFIAPSKAIFLPTIRSRIPVSMQMGQKETVEIGFDFGTLSLKTVFEFLKNNKFLGRKEAKAFIEAAFDYYKTFPLSKEETLATELEAFDRSFRLIELNSPAGNILSTILLMLLEKQRAVQTLKRH
jgi:DNA polymerase-3 subunit delta'